MEALHWFEVSFCISWLRKYYLPVCFSCRLDLNKLSFTTRRCKSLPVLWTNCFRQKSMWCWAQLCKPIFDSVQVNFMLAFILTSVAKGSSSGNPTSNRKFYNVPQKTVVRFTHRMQRIFANYKHNRIKVKALFTRTGEKFAHGILMLLY